MMKDKQKNQGLLSQNTAVVKKANTAQELILKMWVY